MPDLKDDSFETLYEFAIAASFVYHRCEEKQEKLAKWSRTINQ